MLALGREGGAGSAIGAAMQWAESNADAAASRVRVLLEQATRGRFQWATQIEQVEVASKGSVSGLQAEGVAGLATLVAIVAGAVAFKN